MSEQVTAKIPQINLDDYDIKQYVGSSGHSVVCKAIDKKTKKEVAIKAYTSNKKEDLKYYIRGVNVSCCGVSSIVKTVGYRYPLKEEERKTSKYHEYTLPGYKIHGIDKPVDFTGFISVMEYYKINDIWPLMEDYIESNGEKHDIINPTVRSKIIFGVSSIMKQLHEKNAINRDLKIENIFLNDELEPIISGFGFSKFIKNPLEMTMNIGTPYCMAPETFIKSNEPYSFEVDVHSYAFLLYKMFTTKIEFPDKKSFRSIKQYMMRISNGDRPAKPKNIPDHYWELIQKCWKLNPKERPSFDEITNILKNDKFALEEFGMKTNIDELHEYQNKIENINSKSSFHNSNKEDKDSKELKEVKKRLQEYESFFSYYYQPRREDNYSINEEEEKFHEVLTKIGEGSTSIAYEIYDKKSEQLMCKKILKEGPNEQTNFKNMQNTLKEFEVLYRLNHPCICKVIGINISETVNDSNLKEGEKMTTIAMFLEYLDFKLDEIIQSNIKNTLKVRIVIEIAHAMNYIHKKGLIHRDLKVENIMLNSVYESKVVDFGLVRIHEIISEEYSYVKDSLTRRVGTFDYMSPEMLNEEDYDYKTDVYSFGILLYYIFVGHLPNQSLKDKVNGKQITLPSPSPSISQFCIDMIKKCLSHEPSKRPTFEEIIKDIRKHNYTLAANLDITVLCRRDHELELFETK